MLARYYANKGKEISFERKVCACGCKRKVEEGRSRAARYRVECYKLIESAMSVAWHRKNRVPTLNVAFEKEKSWDRMKRIAFNYNR